MNTLADYSDIWAIIVSKLDETSRFVQTRYVYLGHENGVVSVKEVTATNFANVARLVCKAWNLGVRVYRENRLALRKATVSSYLTPVDADNWRPKKNHWIRKMGGCDYDPMMIDFHDAQSVNEEFNEFTTIDEIEVVAHFWDMDFTEW